jgi:hypothetical protein
LDHEAVDDPVKDHAVVIRLRHLPIGARVGPFLRAFGKADEVLDRFRRLPIIETDSEIAFACGEFGVDSQP